MSCCDNFTLSDEPTVDVCPECGGEIDSEGISTEDCCGYAEPCEECGHSVCDESC